MACISIQSEAQISPIPFALTLLLKLSTYWFDYTTVCTIDSVLPPSLPLLLFIHEEISNIIRKAPSKQCDLDPVPTWLVKTCCDLLSPTSTKMVTMCLQQGIFPDSHKHALVRPRLKKPSLDPLDIKSFRPISNLSFLSKVAERLVVDRFNKHADLYHLLPPRQSAYRQHHSTETAITIVRAIDAVEVSVLEFLDLSAAFDTVDHDILFDVLQKQFGVECCKLDWFRSYLSNHTQSFCFTSGQSAPVSLPCSVPQGCRIGLGPQEFIVYTEDIAKTIAAFSLNHHLYPDDNSSKRTYVLWI